MRAEKLLKYKKEVLKHLSKYVKELYIESLKECAFIDAGDRLSFGITDWDDSIDLHFKKNNVLNSISFCCGYDRPNDTTESLYIEYPTNYLCLESLQFLINNRDNIVNMIIEKNNSRNKKHYAEHLDYVDIVKKYNLKVKEPTKY